MTGSAHCTLGPFWSGRLGKTDLVGRQVSDRGGTVKVSMAMTLRNEECGMRIGDGAVQSRGNDEECVFAVSNPWGGPPALPGRQ